MTLSIADLKGMVDSKGVVKTNDATTAHVKITPSRTLPSATSTEQAITITFTVASTDTSK